MINEPIRLGRDIRALGQEIVQAPDQQILRVVALVDNMATRGSADDLLEPLRHRLALLKPPRPLRLPRLIFQPLKPLIVPAAHWRLGQLAIPRSVIVPIAEQIRLAMGPAGEWIEARLAGQTTADAELIARLGCSLWPAAAKILTDSAIPDTWAAAELADSIYRPLADIVAGVLAQAASLHTLGAESATGLLPPRPDIVEAVLGNVSRANPTALPMIIALLLDRVPQVAGLLPLVRSGSIAAVMPAASDEGTDLLLSQLNQPGVIATRIVKASLPDAAAATSRIVTLLGHLTDPSAKPGRREQIQALRQRVKADCMARFVGGLQHELLTPLQNIAASSGPAEPLALETTARALRVLETEGRSIGGGPAYDRLLAQAADMIMKGATDRGDATGEGLVLADRVRLVEILVGRSAALAMLDPTS